MGTAWAGKETVRGINTQPAETAAEYLAALSANLRAPTATTASAL